MDTSAPDSESNWIGDDIASLIEVSRIHHQNFAFFQKLIWPAILFGAAILQLSIWQSSHINHSIPSIYGHYPEVFESAAVRLFGFFADWLFYCFAFGGTAVAVRVILSGQKPEPEESLNIVRTKIIRLFILASIFFALTLLIYIASGLVVGALITVVHRMHLLYPPTLGFVVILGMLFLGFMALSRYALAIPALILDGLPLWKCLNRSDELTEGHMLFLMALIFESVLGGYIALQMPFWIWNVGFASHVVLTWTTYWILRVIGLAGSAAIQPLMFVGFSYLYVTESTPRETEPTPSSFAVWRVKA